MKQHIFRLSIFLLLLFSQGYIHAEERYRFRTLSPEGGFLYDGIRSILQDKDGFIWILMNNDLCRFDGYEYKHFYTGFTQLDTAKEWILYSMAIDSRGTLFVSTENGLYRYDKSSDTFHNICAAPATTVKTDAKDHIWLMSDNQWNILDLETNQLKTPLVEGENMVGGKKLSLPNSIFCLNNEDLYVCGYGNIYRFNETKNEYSLCIRMPNPNKRILQARAYKGKLWVMVQGDGIYKIDLSTFSIEAVFDFFKENESISVRAFYIDERGHIWIGTINGLYVLNTQTGEYTHYQHSQSDPFSLPNNSVWTINEDNQKNIWIGTYSGAVCYVNPNEKIPFTTYFPQEKALSHIPVSAFAEDEASLWIGTEGGGINRMDKETGRFSYYLHENEGNALAHNNIKSMVIDKDRRLWIAMFTGGLDCFHIPSRRFKHFKQNGTDNSLKYNNIRKIIAEGDSGLWIAYQARNLVISFYSFKRQSFTHYSLEKEGKNFYIFDILRGKGNQLWILSNEKLYLLHVESGAITEVQIKANTFMNFHAFCMDDSGNLWMGTIGNGLIKYKPETGEYRIYDNLLQHDDFSSIYSICYDDERNIWLGTNNGLVRYNIDSNRFSRYDKKDGVQGQVYYPLASLKGMDGHLYFGGTNGFTAIKPSEISPNIYRPQAIISDFYINYSPSKSILEANREEISLNHRQENFGFKFSSDNYLIPEKNLFRYRLRGYYDHWIETDASRREIQYSKVKAGVYYFEVEAANNDGLWSGWPTTIKIVRRPNPWQSWPALISYALLFAAICWVMAYYFRMKKKLELQLYLENIEKNKQEELHQSQLRFFANISHDFKTPLSLIIASVEKLHREGLKESYYWILNRNSRRLLNLVDEIMDLQTIENGVLNLKLQAVDVKAYVQEIAADFADYTAQRNIAFTVHCDTDFPACLNVDKNMLEKIIMNLLNNSLRFTKDGGSIGIELLSSRQRFKSPYSARYAVKDENVFSGDGFVLVIRDNGIGIEKQVMDRIFDRFYKSNSVNTDTYVGTGIGLSLVKSLVLLHKGAICVCSELNRGTDIAICLPLEKATPEVNEEHKAPATYTQEEVLSELLPSEKKRILLVEDNEDLKHLLADFLSSDFDVLTASNGLKATEMLSNRLIDMVISDIMMPIKDGVTLCSEIKNRVEISHIPVILLTAKTGIESRIEGVDSGADVYLEKPVDLNLLKLSIQNIFRHQQQLKEYYAKNHYADSTKLFSNERDNRFLKDFIQVIEDNMSHSEMDVDLITSALSMSRSKLYRKIKGMTGKSIIEFILSQRLRKAARLIIENNLSIREVMDEIGIESQAYFTNAFKKEFGETPTMFANRQRAKM
ncbi:MAG: response regulator [Dysgonamonadaceae bacterium]|jgi:signal transduction histidine kinase/ligand-binding sensor domain-containing protein/DNA-binding response OmpR family regulator|nr:response regulator [Dysgonamonadaceae bacterium]